MLKEFVEKILTLAEPKEIICDGRVFLSGNVKEIADEFTRLDSCSLNGLIDFCKTRGNISHVLVKSPTEIVVYGFESNNRTNPILFVSKAMPKTFPFSQRLSHEEFIISLRTCFMPCDDIDSLLGALSRVTSGPVSTSSDDGVSQTFSLRAGVALKEDAIIKPVRKLSAYRSFSGFASPETEYLFRAHSTKETGAISFSLTDMQGDAWIGLTVDALREHLKDKIENLTEIY
jgi:hypothetical protein